MAYAYLVVTLDIMSRPPRVLAASVERASGKTLPHQEGCFQFDVMMASGKSYEQARHNLFVMSKIQMYADQTHWAFRLLPAQEFGEWSATPAR